MQEIYFYFCIFFFTYDFVGLTASSKITRKKKNGYHHVELAYTIPICDAVS